MGRSSVNVDVLRFDNEIDGGVILNVEGAATGEAKGSVVEEDPKDGKGRAVL